MTPVCMLLKGIKATYEKMFGKYKKANALE